MNIYYELVSIVYNNTSETVVKTWNYYNIANMPPQIGQFIGTEAELQTYLKTLGN